MIQVWFQEGGGHLSSPSFRTTVLQTAPSHCLFSLFTKGKEGAVAFNYQPLKYPLYYLWSWQKQNLYSQIISLFQSLLFSLSLLTISPEPKSKLNRCAAVGSKGEKAKEVGSCGIPTPSESTEKSLGMPCTYIWGTSYWLYQREIMFQMTAFHFSSSKETK